MKGRWLGNGHDCLEGQWGTVRIVSISDATHRMTQDLDRRLRHVLVVVGCTGLSEVLEFPWLLCTGLDVELRLDSSQVALVPRSGRSAASLRRGTQDLPDRVFGARGF